MSLFLFSIAFILIFLIVALARKWYNSIAFFCLATLLAIYGMSMFPGRPKPSSWEVLDRNISEAKVLWSSARPADGIYLVLTWRGQPEPRLYVLPWKEKLAEQLYKAQRAGKESGMGVIIRKPFKDTDIESEGSGNGNGKEGDGSANRKQGGGTGDGESNQDNKGASERFYSPPPPAIPRKG